MVTAAILVIGDEILSGRTKDKNIGYIAEYLTAIGIDLSEVRVVPDVEDEIVAAVNALRSATTMSSPPAASGRPMTTSPPIRSPRPSASAIDFDPRAVAHPSRAHPASADLNQARLRMARIPDGADLIENTVSKAPGFTIGNVHVMAGVPSIMQAMLDALAPRPADRPEDAVALGPGGPKEGDIAGPLGAVQADFPDVIIGSYPTFDPVTGFTRRWSLRSREEGAARGGRGGGRSPCSRKCAPNPPG